MNVREWNYWQDHRVAAAMSNANRAWWVVGSRGRGLVTVEFSASMVESIVDEGLRPDDWDGTEEFRSNCEVCPLCSGHGKVVDPAVDAGGITDFDEAGIDPDAYFGGRYDITCPECRGRNVVDHPDFNDLAEHLRTWEEEEYQYQRMVMAERRYGA